MIEVDAVMPMAKHVMVTNPPKKRISIFFLKNTQSTGDVRRPRVTLWR